MKTKKMKLVWKHIFLLISSMKKSLLIIIICLLITAYINFIQPLIIKHITDYGIVKLNINVLISSVMILFCVKVMESVISVLQNYSFARIHNNVTKKLNSIMFEKLYHLPISYFTERSGAGIINTMKMDIDSIASISDNIAALSITAVFQFLAGIVGIFIINREIAFVMIILLPIKYCIVNIFSTKKNDALNKSLKKDNYYYSWLGEQADGIKELKLWNLYTIKYNKLKNMQLDIARSYQENTMLDSYYTSCEEIMDTIITCMLYLLGGWLVLKNNMTFGGLLAVISYSTYIMTPLAMLINLRYYFARIMPSAIRFNNFLELQEEKYISTNNNCLEDDTMKPIIEFDHVSFSYNNRDELLKDISFKMYRGEKIAIVGLNGVGKSTIFDLLLGLYQPDRGEIRIGGNLINDVGIEKTRKRIAVVNQKPYFFNASVKANIDLNEKGDFKSIQEISRKCGADGFIIKFPEKYEEIIGQNGRKLSGGEKQKLAIARALLKEADIVLLDEATNSLDIRMNDNSIYEKFVDKSIIIITHKADEMMNVDRVYQLKDGHLMEVIR